MQNEMNPQQLKAPLIQMPESLIKGSIQGLNGFNGLNLFQAVQ